MALRIQIAKFKFRQCLLRANSPNLVLAKLSRYTVDIVHHNYLIAWFNDCSESHTIIRTSAVHFCEKFTICDTLPME